MSEPITDPLGFVLERAQLAREDELSGLGRVCQFADAVVDHGGGEEHAAQVGQCVLVVAGGGQRRYRIPGDARRDGPRPGRRPARHRGHRRAAQRPPLRPRPGEHGPLHEQMARIPVRARNLCHRHRRRTGHRHRPLRWINAGHPPALLLRPAIAPAPPVVRGAADAEPQPPGACWPVWGKASVTDESVPCTGSLRRGHSAIAGCIRPGGAQVGTGGCK
jgi:hypothetical protein